MPMPMGSCQDFQKARRNYWQNLLTSYVSYFKEKKNLIPSEQRGISLPILSYAEISTFNFQVKESDRQ